MTAEWWCRMDVEALERSLCQLAFLAQTPLDHLALNFEISYEDAKATIVMLQSTKSYAKTRIAAAKWAVRMGNVVLLRAFLDTDPDIWCRKDGADTYPHNASLLYNALYYNMDACVEELVERPVPKPETYLRALAVYEERDVGHLIARVVAVNAAHMKDLWSHVPYGCRSIQCAIPAVIESATTDLPKLISHMRKEDCTHFARMLWAMRHACAVNLPIELQMKVLSLVYSQ